MGSLFANVLPPCEPLIRLTGLSAVAGIAITDLVAMIGVFVLVAVVLARPTCPPND